MPGMMLVVRSDFEAQGSCGDTHQSGSMEGDPSMHGARIWPDTGAEETRTAPKAAN
jgi:hypothetical protein